MTVFKRPLSLFVNAVQEDHFISDHKEPRWTTFTFSLKTVDLSLKLLNSSDFLSKMLQINLLPADSFFYSTIVASPFWAKQQACSIHVQQCT